MSDKSLGGFSVFISAAVKLLRDQTKVISYEAASINSVIPRLTKIIRSGITFVSRNLR